MKVVFFQEEPRPLHLAAARRQVEFAFLAGKDIFSQNQDHIALDPGYFRGLIDLYLFGVDAAVSLADFHPACRGIEVVGGIIGNRVGTDPPGASLEALALEQVHLRNRPGAPHAEKEDQAP